MTSAISRLPQHSGYVGLPKRACCRGFQHAAVHAATGQVHVTQTANNAVAGFDPASRSYLFWMPQLRGVAGILASDEAQLIIAANRADNTIAIFPAGSDPQVSKVAVGIRPNARLRSRRRRILVANVGDPTMPAAHTLTARRGKCFRR